MVTLPMPNRFELLGQIGHNTLQTLTQDPAALKNDAAFWATLIHVVTRIIKAKQTAAQPADPQEKQYREQMSAMTFFREAVGFTSSWVVIKTVDKVLKGALRRAFAYEEVSPGTTPISGAIHQAWEVLRGKRTTVDAVPEAITGFSQWRRTLKEGQTLAPWKDNLTEGLGYFLSRLQDKPLSQHLDDAARAALRLEGFKALHTVLPILAGVPLALGISGWWLERTTLLHGQAVVNILMQGNGDGTNATLGQRLQALWQVAKQAVTGLVRPTSLLPGAGGAPSSYAGFTPPGLPMPVTVPGPQGNNLTPSYSPAPLRPLASETPYPFSAPLTSSTPRPQSVAARVSASPASVSSPPVPVAAQQQRQQPVAPLYAPPSVAAWSSMPLGSYT